MITDHDEQTTRCRMLGHSVPFRYCRTLEGRRLCPRILDRWWEVFDVQAFLEEHLTAEELGELAPQAPRHKVSTLLDIADQVRQKAAEAVEGESRSPDGGE